MSSAAFFPAPASVIGPARAGGLLLRALLALLLGALLSGHASSSRADDFLDPEQAFRLGAQVRPDGAAELVFGIADGYYLYREQFRITTHPAGAAVVVTLPRGEIKHDATFGRDMEVHHRRAVLQLRLDAATPAGAPLFLVVRSQGCAEAGLCYPPQVHVLRASVGEGGRLLALSPVAADEARAAGVDTAGAMLAQAEPDADAIGADAIGADANGAAADGGAKAAHAPSAAPAARGSSGEIGRLQAVLQQGRLLPIAGAFALAGLLLAFTPCVLPMVPILSSILIGHGGAHDRPHRKGRGFLLALAYALGMAVVYTLLGVAAGLAGEGLAAWLQNPWVLGAFGLLLVALALSMFGVYTLQMPAALQTRLSAASGRLRGGTLLGAAGMGMLSALVVGPCVAAPLAGALIYISQTRDVVIGGVALFAMAMGMSLPLLAMGASAGALLPRVGPWMERVKTVFGLLLLAVAWWLVQPVLPAWAVLSLAAVWLGLAAAFLGAFDTLGASASLRHRAAKGAGLALAVLAAVQIVGAVAGARSPWQPLAPFTGAGSAQAQVQAAALPFRRIASVAELDAALQAAAGRPVMLDFYADWCVSCKEMEHLTFSDEAVRARLAGAVLLQADVTANTPEHRALLKRFGLFGPPGIVFFDRQGREVEGTRVIGFEGPQDFIASLQRAGL
ncbi:MAG: protein-disulfide reductase DsbD [Burkholderiales bacterium]|nr:protein-disulfide reductase DsbD [Burkholderiales bacterium]